MKRIIAWILFLIMSMSVFAGCVLSREQQYQATYFDLFDTVTTIMGYAETEEEFQEIADVMYEELKNYHQLFDIYHEYEGNNLKTVNDQAGIAPVEVDKEIIALLLDCRKYYEMTDGAVNASMGSVLSLWHEARSAALENPENAVLPPENTLTEAAEHVSFDNVVIDEEASTIYLTDPAQSLDVGAIAKGWAAERVCEDAPEGFLISIGGNVCVTGPKPDGSSWNIGIQNPEDSNEYIEKVSIARGSVVTSGDYQRYMEVDGNIYHHLIDPKTQYPAIKWKSVTVVCVDSGLADALSTALFVLGKEEGENILEQCKAEAMWIRADGKIIYSDGFGKHF